jgi:hypothetical protein
MNIKELQEKISDVLRFVLFALKNDLRIEFLLEQRLLRSGQENAMQNHNQEKTVDLNECYIMRRSLNMIFRYRLIITNKPLIYIIIIEIIL